MHDDGAGEGCEVAEGFHGVGVAVCGAAVVLPVADELPEQREHFAAPIFVVEGLLVEVAFVCGVGDFACGEEVDDEGSAGDVGGGVEPVAGADELEGVGDDEFFLRVHAAVGEFAGGGDLVDVLGFEVGDVVE